MADRTVAAVVEIIERGKVVDEGKPCDDLIVPDEVRINGQPVFMSSEHPIVVHSISTQDAGLVSVTLTLLARRVIVGAEGDVGQVLA